MIVPSCFCDCNISKNVFVICGADSGSIVAGGIQKIAFMRLTAAPGDSPDEKHTRATSPQRYGLPGLRAYILHFVRYRNIGRILRVGQQPAYLHCYKLPPEKKCRNLGTQGIIVKIYSVRFVGNCQMTRRRKLSNAHVVSPGYLLVGPEEDCSPAPCHNVHLVYQVPGTEGKLYLSARTDGSLDRYQVLVVASLLSIV